jgi:hypothetical protein
MNKQELEYYARRYGLLIIISLAVIAFLVPLFIRLLQGSPLTPGAVSYTHLRYANLLEQGVVGYDPLRDTPIAPNPYVALLAIMQVFGVPWMLPMLLSLALIMLLHFYLERFIADRAAVVLALIALVLSPTMSVLSTHLRPLLLAMCLIVAAALLFERRPFLAYVALLFALITHPVIGLLAVVYFMISMRGKETTIGLLIAIAIAIAWSMVWTGALPEMRELTSPVFNPSIFFELGTAGGISVFFVLAASYAVAVKFSRLRIMAALTALLLVGALIIPSLLPFAAIAVSTLVGISLLLLISGRWELELIKQSLIVLLACTGLFLFIVTVRESAGDAPDADFAHAMTALRNQYREGAVLSHPSSAPLIEYFTGRRSHTSVPREVFLSRDAKQLYGFLDRTGTSYIFITEEMEQELFTRSDEGILFLLENTGRFVMIDSTGGTRTWYYIKT